MQSTENSEMIQCPYNKAHLIMKSRFQVHLGRCKKNYPESEKVTCPFNVTHWVDKPELTWHVQTCTDRSSFDRYKYKVDNGTIARIKDDPPKVYPKLLSEDNWDDSPRVETYNPESYTNNAPVLRLKKGAPPSERKAFRLAEFKRLNAINN